MNTIDKTRRARTILIFVVILFVIVTSWFFYQNRCHFISCTFTSWKTIQTIAFARTNNDTKISYVIARPSKWNSYSESGPAFIDIDIGYMTKAPDGIGVGDFIYRPEFIRFDDKTLLTHHYIGDSLTTELPSLESQEILKRVKLHPRDAFAAIWKLAQSESSLSPQSLAIFANLLTFDGNKVVDGHESIWHIYYGDKLTYAVDARTGEIISVQRWQ